MTVGAPGGFKEIRPPQAHMHVLVRLSAGMLPISTVGEPGVHGAVTTGMHGIGENTPSFAAVAAATVGLVSVMHAPNGGMFISGLLSAIVAVGCPASVRATGATTSVAGDVPNTHLIIVPLIASGGIPS
jgi:hypothetical protein